MNTQQAIANRYTDSFKPGRLSSFLASIVRGEKFSARLQRYAQHCGQVFIGASEQGRGVLQ